MPKDPKASLERLYQKDSFLTGQQNNGMSLKEKRQNLSMNPQQHAQLKQSLQKNN